jgi:hypothetical protein
MNTVTGKSNIERIEFQASNLIQPIMYLLLTFHFILNFLGLPIIKWLYLIEVIFVVFVVVFNDLNKSIIPILGIFFIEGQGRILWSYHPLFRNIFDLIIALAILKSISLKKTIMPRRTLPYGVLFLIGFHFLWFALQIFNIYSAGIVSVISASKIYIFPFFMFFMFLNNPLEKDTFVKIQRFTLFVVFFECALSIHQMNLKEQSLLPLTPYYAKSMRDIFVGVNFRPYGTAYVPGAFSVYFFLTVGFLFMGTSRLTLKKLIITSSQVFTLFCLFIMQVRSALIKHILIALGISFGIFIYSKYKFKTLVKYAAMFGMLIGVISFLPNKEQLFPDIDFETSMGRLEALENTEVTEHRAGLDKIVNLAVKKLSEEPLGLGPGRTGAAASIGASFIMNDPVYDINASWTYDNLLISLIIDLGLGSIFYILTVVILYLKLLYNTIATYRGNDDTKYRLTLVSFISCTMILVGNWGAIGLTYNPESFIFWFFMATGLNTIYQKDSEAIEVSENKATI